MNYVIIEMQTNAQGTTAIVTPAVYDNDVTAEADFLFKCGYARQSGMPCHSVVLMNQEGRLIARKAFVVEE